MWTNENRSLYDRSTLRYPSDLTDEEWALIEPLIPPAKRGGGNVAAFWKRERWGIPLQPGLDEVSLALAADSWSRTYRSHVVTFAATSDAHPSRHGLRILPDKVSARWPSEQLLPSSHSGRPAMVLNQALAGIASRYGTRTADVVAMQLEYAWPRLTR